MTVDIQSLIVGGFITGTVLFLVRMFWQKSTLGTEYQTVKKCQENRAECVAHRTESTLALGREIKGVKDQMSRVENKLDSFLLEIAKGRNHG